MLFCYVILYVIWAIKNSLDCAVCSLPVIRFGKRMKLVPNMVGRTATVVVLLLVGMITKRRTANAYGKYQYLLVISDVPLPVVQYLVPGIS